MSLNVEALFKNIWQQYLSVTPSADKIHQLLSSGDDLINDHVAFRTFNIAKVNLESLAEHLIELGYKECGQYHFELKKLDAKHFEHSNPELPKVFISELMVEKLSTEAQIIINRIVADIDSNLISSNEFLYSGRTWELSSQEYKTLLKESEYAAWLATWGYQANHFTVSVNHLAQYTALEQVNQRLKDSGFSLNTSGGEIKGNVEVMLEQSSTMADSIEVEFTDTQLKVPSCFYEFAKRHPKPCGNLYTGFVAASADKIFESTNQQ
ncbi:DUF1338 domain-containing protein [Thalassotalea crassostreae]|uniref:DUF1338 domain-containing protein n=1 Tax=Thalassotalea crassostreae TaxID=1763536 RepID=UPI0008381F76|nr:DUF1338 domain-containing protein [Thalassotalea crassostreae]